MTKMRKLAKTGWLASVEDNTQMKREIKDISRGSDFMEYMLTKYKWLYMDMIGEEEQGAAETCEDNCCSGGHLREMGPDHYKQVVQKPLDMVLDTEAKWDRPVHRHHRHHVTGFSRGCMTVSCKSHNEHDEDIDIAEKCIGYQKKREVHPFRSVDKCQDWVKPGYYDNYLGLLIRKQYQQKMTEICDAVLEKYTPVRAAAYLCGYCASFFPHSLDTGMSQSAFLDSITFDDVPGKQSIQSLQDIKINAVKYVFLMGVSSEDEDYADICDEIAGGFRSAGLPGTVLFTCVNRWEMAKLEHRNSVDCYGSFQIDLSEKEFYVSPQVCPDAVNPNSGEERCLAKLTERQLVLLNSLLYVDTTFAPGMSVGTLVDELLGEHLLPCLIFGGGLNFHDAHDMLMELKGDEALRELVINSRVESRIRGVAFSYPNASDAVIVFRGTGPYYAAWDDNCQGGYLISTEMQREALQFADNWLRRNRYDIRNEPCLLLTGHSKGGNLAQYVTVLRHQAVQRCVSLDGQGFGSEFVDFYRKEIHKCCGKIRSVCAYNDFVNILLKPIASEIVYLKNKKLGKGGHYIYELYRHKGNTFDGNGRYITVRKPGLGIWLLKRLIRNFARSSDRKNCVKELKRYTFAGHVMGKFYSIDGNESREIEREFVHNIKDFVDQEFHLRDGSRYGHGENRRR